LINNLIFVI